MGMMGGQDERGAEWIKSILTRHERDVKRKDNICHDPVLCWNFTLVCRVLFLSSSLCDFPCLQCSSITFPHLSFSHLTPPLPDPLISVSFNSLCSPSGLCLFVPCSLVMPPCFSHQRRLQRLPVVCFCFFLFLEFSFVLHFLEASFHYYFVVCPWDTFLFFFPGFVPFSFC